MPFLVQHRRQRRFHIAPRHSLCAEIDPGFAPLDDPDRWSPLEEPDEPSECDDLLMPWDGDDPRWDTILPEEEPYERLPDPSDFWIDTENE
jgi:hypothetical protein